MQLAHLALFCCPTCQGALTLNRGNEQLGSVVCPKGHTFRIIHGVLDLLKRARPQSIAAWVNELAPTAWLCERIWRPYALTLLSGESFPYTRELAWLSQHVPDTSRTIVDVACSNGLYARALATSHPQAQIIGIDRSLPMLRQAVARAQALQLPISYVRADARALPFVSASIDAVVVGGSWNEMEALPTVFKEMARISAPQARLVAMALTQSPRRVGQFVQRMLGTGGTQFFDPTTLAQQLTQFGWYDIHSQVTGIVWQGVATRAKGKVYGQS